MRQLILLTDSVSSSPIRLLSSWLLIVKTAAGGADNRSQDLEKTH